MKRTCSGYRDQSSLMFRDETTRTVEKSQRWQSRVHGLHAGPASNTTLSAPRTRLAGMTLAPPLSTATEDVITCHFYHTTLANLSEQDPSRHLHAQLPGLYAKSHPGSALRLATEAISYSVSTELVPEASRLSRKRYIQATRAVRLALQGVQGVEDDQTLYAILLLCGYEVCPWTPLELLSIRGMSQLTAARDYHVGLTGTASMGIPC